MIRMPEKVLFGFTTAGARLRVADARLRAACARSPAGDPTSHETKTYTHIFIIEDMCIFNAKEIDLIN